MLVKPQSLQVLIIMASSLRSRSQVSKDLDLLLIGKTGNGKSALGNHIIGQKTFRSTASATSVTSEVKHDYAKYKDRNIKVVDTPGVCDTGLNEKANKEKVTQMLHAQFCNAIRLHPNGYHAFILVVKYGGRFTEEDKSSVDFLKNIFGKDFVSSFCIIVMTGGDCFENDAEDNNITFEDWWQEQEGVFRYLLEECNERIVLFDNTTKDTRKREKQLDQLIYFVDNLKASGRRYTDKYFAKAKKSREKLLISSAVPIVEEETQRETRYLLMELHNLKGSNPKDILPLLRNMHERAKAIYGSIQDQDKGTGVLNKYLETMQSVKNCIDTEIKINDKLLQQQTMFEKEKQAADDRKIKEIEEREKRAQAEYTRLLQQERQMREQAEQMYQAERDRMAAEAAKDDDSFCCIL